MRRNLQRCKPDTISKTKPATEDFFAVLMNFPTPKPRHIEKDIKVSRASCLLFSSRSSRSFSSPSFFFSRLTLTFVPVFVFDVRQVFKWKDFAGALERTVAKYVRPLSSLFVACVPRLLQADCSSFLPFSSPSPSPTEPQCLPLPPTLPPPVRQRRTETSGTNERHLWALSSSFFDRLYPLHFSLSLKD